MSEFKSALKVEVSLDGGDRILLEDLVYYSSLVDEEIIAQKGMRTDYGSIHKLLHSILSPSGKATYGFVIHDKLYFSGKYSKRESDDILGEAMKLLKVSWLQRKLIIAGLRVGGFVAWNMYRKKDKKNEK